MLGDAGGTSAGELDREGWCSPCPTALVGITHAVPLEEQKMNPPVSSVCLHSPLEDPHLPGGSWGPRLNLGPHYRPSSYRSWWNLLQTLFLQGVLMTHPTVDWAPRDASPVCFLHPVAAMRMDDDMSWMPILLQPWPKRRARMHGCTSNVQSEWMARLCKKELKLDLSTSPVS